MSRRRRAFIAVVAGVTLAGVFAARVMRARPARRALPVNVETAPPVAAQAAPSSAPAFAPAANPGAQDSTDAPLTPDGAARALQAIGKNEQTRVLFGRLLATGLSREQQNQVVLILGTAALRPPPQSATLTALRADGRSQALTPEQGKRIIEERKRASDQSVRALRPALAAVLTPAQLAQAGLGDDPPRR
ncbi:MAG: hypothetical protein ACJ8F1_17630 [Polyangia bacterium]